MSAIKKYVVTIRQVVYYHAEVEAMNPEMARAIAEDEALDPGWEQIETANSEDEIISVEEVAE